MFTLAATTATVVTDRTAVFVVHAAAVVDAALFVNVGLVFFKLDCFKLDLGLDQLLDVGQQASVVAATHKGHCQAGGASAARAANAVHIVFGVEGDVEVEHRGHILDVQTARSHIGTHQQVNFALLEGFQRLEAFVLTLVAVQRCRLETFVLQRTGQAGTTEFAVHKHKGLLHAALFQDLVQRMALAVFVDAVEMLLHGRSGRIGACHFNGDRVLQVAVGQALDFGRKRRRKQQRGALLGQVAQDALQVGQKADVEHAVGFVQHHVFDLVEDGVLGFDVVQQTAGRGHQHFHPFLQLQRLWLHVHAAKHHGAAQVGVLGVQLDLLGDLVGQFTGGQQHQRTHRVAGGGSGSVFVLHHALQQGQCKGSGFAGAGLGGAHDVLAGQHHRNGLGLDRGHGLVAHFSHGAGDGGGQLQLGKGHDGSVGVQLVGSCRRHGSGGSQFSIQIGPA